jgi:hypothetical protein
VPALSLRRRPAQHLHGVPNIAPDALCEAMTKLGGAFDAALD